MLYRKLERWRWLRRLLDRLLLLVLLLLLQLHLDLHVLEPCNERLLNKGIGWHLLVRHLVHELLRYCGYVREMVEGLLQVRLGTLLFV